MKPDWKKKKLGDVSVINYGYTESASSDEVGPKFLRITDIQNDRVNWDDVPYCTIESRDLPKYRLATGDIVFARTGATTGKSFLISDPPKAVFASYLIRLRLIDSELLPEFVSLFFQSTDYWRAIKEGSSGSAQGGFNATKLGALTVSVPPLPEQHRIVTILDEAFDGIATAKANAEKNLQNARALFESHLQSVFTERGEGWVERSLGELSRINYGYTESASAEKVGPRFLRITDIQNNSVDWNSVPYCPIEESDFPKFQLTHGDIVFARTGATTGKSYLVKHPPEAVFASYLIRLRLNSIDLLAEFVNLFFQTHTYWDSIRSGVSGSAQGGFNATKQKSLLHQAFSGAL